MGNRIELYNKVCLECSRITTNRYSTSFSLGTRLFDNSTRKAIFAIYGFVRFADEIVDSFHQFDKQELLNRFKSDTYKAIEEGISLNPVLQSFQLVVNQYGLERHLLDAFLHSMEMDLNPTTYDRGKIAEYIYGSAEVVGLMCLKVFCRGDQQKYEELYQPARRLGAAFQKINFLRDIGEDFNDMGRVYFPNVDFNNFTLEQKLQIEADIQSDFDAALEGIKMLEDNSKLGVYVAYRYYLSLFDKIKRIPPHKLIGKRYRISNTKKILLMASCWAGVKIGLV
jgi:phytoene/squalene synthetase